MMRKIVRLELDKLSTLLALTEFALNMEILSLNTFEFALIIRSR